ncbi:MAG: ABC transporter ATP-binding protein [Bacilli bacterium]|nr:ABC transporter ATP-binding protein [Bacilli bacterium]
MEKDYIFELKDVTIDYKMKMFSLRANDQVSINLERGKITALVGESGSGKTTLATSLLNCVSEPGEITGGNVLFHSKDGTTLDVAKLSGEDLRLFRWAKVSMVFQGSQSALNPVMTIGAQFAETMKEHDRRFTKEQIKAKSEEVLGIVNLDPDRVLSMYPHELSGGMKQRVMIAFSLLLDPEFIILDEPTTALDVITQDYIFNILKDINVKRGISMLLLTHDIAIVSKYADYIGVMYGGKLMEFGDVYSVFEKKSHPYTEGLIKATPSLICDISEIESIPGHSPSFMEKVSGCLFNPRCKYAKEECSKEVPEMYEISSDHCARCFRAKKKGESHGE